MRSKAKKAKTGVWICPKQHRNIMQAEKCRFCEAKNPLNLRK